jgi:hypothetical protein
MKHILTGLFPSMLLALAVPLSAQFGGWAPSEVEKELREREEAARVEREVLQAKHRFDDAVALVDQEERTMGRQYDPKYREQRIGRLSTAPTGAGGIGADFAIDPAALGDAVADLVYTPVAPCRIIDTRVAGGALGATSARPFLVAGADFTSQGGVAGSCGVPLGPATVAHVNIVAVAPAGGGNLRAWAYGQAEPNASIINYQSVTPNLNIANAVNVPLCSGSCPYDLAIRANLNAVHIVADVLGYFSRAPREQVRSFVVRNSTAATVDIATTCTTYTNVTVVAPVAGTVTVRANWQTSINHLNGTISVYIGVLSNSASSCFSLLGFDNYAYLPASLPTGDYRPVIPLSKTFPVSAGTHTFYLNAQKTSGNSGQHWYAGLEAEFHPN